MIRMAEYEEIENDDIMEDDFHILEIIDYGFPYRIYPRSQHFDELDDLGFYRRFRLTKKTSMNLLVLIENEIEYPTDVISPINHLLTCLRFYATNGHLQSVADFADMHLATVCRIINRVSRAIAKLYGQFIKMPDNEDEIGNKHAEFYNIASFPRVLAAVDVTHIKIQSPGGQEGEIYRNNRGYFSINVQALTDANLNLLDLVSRWPGSTHDSTIFNNCRVKALLEAGQFPDSFVLGDSGYPLRNYFLTPLANPNGRAQQLYNESHIRTRNTIERLFGVWKRRFPVLAYGLRLKIETVFMVIVATGVLYNFAKMNNEGDPPPAEGINEEELQYLIELGPIPQISVYNDNLAVNVVRDEFVNNYFANL